MAGDGARCSSRRGEARHGMGAPPQGGLGQVDTMVTRDKRSEKLRIFVGSVAEVIEKRAKRSIGLVAVLEPARRRVSDLFYDSYRYRGMQAAVKACPVSLTLRLRVYSLIYRRFWLSVRLPFKIILYFYYISATSSTNTTNIQSVATEKGPR
jgi:hypothetical protein